MKRLPYTWFQKITLLLSALLVAGMFGFLIFNYSALPQQIPTHFGLNGKPDAWGGRGSLWITPVFSAALFLFLAAITHFPAIWNMPSSLNERNQEYLYRQTKNLLCAVNFEIIILNAYTQFCSVSSQPLNMMILCSLVILLVAGPIIWAIYLNKKGKSFT